MGAVSAPPGDPDEEGVGRGHKAAFPQTHRAAGQIGPAVGADGQIRLVVFQQAGLQHCGGAGAGLLRRLEEEENLSLQLLPHLGEHPRTQQKGGRVDVVAAAVAHSRALRGKGEAGLFLHGQRVNVRPEHKGLSRLAALEQGGRAGGEGHILDEGDAVGLQRLLDQPGGVDFFHGQLGMAVEVPPQLYRVRSILLDQRGDLLHDLRLPSFRFFQTGQSPRSGRRPGSPPSPV